MKGRILIRVLVMLTYIAFYFSLGFELTLILAIADVGISMGFLEQSKNQ